MDPNDLPHAALLDGLGRLLDAIEERLRALPDWEGLPPSSEQLASDVPFCHDTLEFTQWLQWIFLPRFRALLDARAPLPASCGIAPIAELAFAERAGDTTALLALLAAFDEAVTTRRLP